MIGSKIIGVVAAGLPDNGQEFTVRQLIFFGIQGKVIAAFTGHTFDILMVTAALWTFHTVILNETQQICKKIKIALFFFFHFEMRTVVSRSKIIIDENNNSSKLVGRSWTLRNKRKRKKKYAN